MKSTIENYTSPRGKMLLENGLIYSNTIVKIIKNGIRLNVMGDISVLSEDLKEIIKKQMKETEKFSEHVLNIAINYGGKAEIVKAVKEIVENKEDITEENISKHLYTFEFGEPELIIRTSGEKRLSNFMLYQSAYSELYFTDVLWPDFDEKCFEEAIADYCKRNRRFGNI